MQRIAILLRKIVGYMYFLLLPHSYLKVVCYYGITGAHVNLMSTCWTTHAPQGAKVKVWSLVDLFQYNFFVLRLFREHLSWGKGKVKEHTSQRPKMVVAYPGFLSMNWPFALIDHMINFQLTRKKFPFFRGSKFLLWVKRRFEPRNA